MIIIPIYNIKGGVGKTTAAVNLSSLAARDGYRTLLWDLDPQGASSFCLRIKPKIKGGAKKMISKSQEITSLIKGSDFDNLDLLPADFSNRNLDLIIDDYKNPNKRLQKVLKPLAKEYDLVFVDCPPAISLLSESVFFVADVILVPLTPAIFSLNTLKQIREFLQRKGLDQLEVIPFFSMVDARRKLHREILADATNWQLRPSKATIPYSSAVELMAVKRAPLAEYVRKNNRARASFENLWDDVKNQACL